MAKRPASQKPASTPEDFHQVEPTELFPTNNIRFVISETAKLIERVETLSRSIDKLGSNFEKQLEKQGTDLKDRIAEVKSDAKSTHADVKEMKGSIDSFKGAIKVFGGLYALAMVVAAALLTWFLRPIAPPATPSAVTQAK